MKKRATTDYSFVVGVHKPAGLSSHDVVNRVRRIYGERRVGHTGTLDPAATGVLAVCVGPAARLDRFLTGHDKTYEFTCVFGEQTTTDDAEGDVIERASVPPQACDYDFAVNTLALFRGPSMQLPPAYSAIKVDGKTAYKEARTGKPLALDPRSIVVHSLDLLGIDCSNPARPVWRLKTCVSAGTYVRSLARDLGAALGTYAHVGTLHRVRAGNLDISECVSLETLESDPFRYLLDPIKLLGVRVVFADGILAKRIAVGNAVPAEGLELFAYDKRALQGDTYCSCTSGISLAPAPLAPGEVVGMIVENKLMALYEYDETSHSLKSCCGFSIGVARGGNL